MSETPQDTPIPIRLDSWKAIAAYLQRDERTAQRWERELGLPVRRVPGGRGRSVFAFAFEIDAWLKATHHNDSEPLAADAASAEAPADPPALHQQPVADSVPRRVPTTAWRRGALVALLILAALAWWMRPATASVADLRIAATADGVVATDAAGRTRWTYRFSTAYKTMPAEDMPDPTRVTGGEHPAIYVASAYRDRRSDEGQEGGEITQLDVNGHVERSFAFADTVTVGGTSYGPPWIVTMFAVDDTAGARRVAIAAHHAVWDASLVTVLDGQMKRLGTFVHAGWIEQLQWLSPDRLLIGGFSNAHDGGMVALLDPTAPHSIDGQGPEPPGSRYYCQTCAAGAPLKMVIMPRTELNRVTASRFNRARLQVTLGRILARTIEIPSPIAADALYEFTPSLDLIRASYSDHYWELHRALEAEGTLHRPRDQSPDKDGPIEIQVWEPTGGWRTQKIR